MAKYEKVDSHTIKIIVEKSQNVPLSQILANKQKLLEQKTQIETALKNIEELLKEAERLKITPEISKSLKKDDNE